MQDASGYVGDPLTIALQVKLLDSFGDAIYFKPDALPIGQRLSNLHDAGFGKARRFRGIGRSSDRRQLSPEHRMAMPGAELCWALQALWQSLLNKNWDRAYAIGLPLTGLIMLQSGLDGFVAIEKYLLVRQNVLPTARARGPLSYRLDPETAAEVDRLYSMLREAVDGRGDAR